MSVDLKESVVNVFDLTIEHGTQDSVWEAGISDEEREEILYTIITRTRDTDRETPWIATCLLTLDLKARKDLLAHRQVAFLDLYLTDKAKTESVVGVYALKNLFPEQFDDAAKMRKEKWRRSISYTNLASYKMAFPNEPLGISETEVDRYVRQKKGTLALERLRSATELRIIIPEFDVSRLVTAEEILELNKMYKKCKERSMWPVALDYGFQSYVLTAPRLVIDNQGIHALPKKAVNTSQMPEARSF